MSNLQPAIRDLKSAIRNLPGSASLRVFNLVWKEIIQFERDRLLTAFIFLLPIIQLLLLAQATGRRISDMRVAVLDVDRSAVSRQLISDVDNREELTVYYLVADETELRQLLDAGEVDAGIILPAGLEENAANPTREVQVKIIVDGSNSVAGSIALGAASGVFADYGTEQLAAWGRAVAPPIDMRVVTYYNPTFNTRHFTIPAQVGFITYQITLAFAALGLARERELGTLEQLIVAPLSRLELALGKAIPAFIIGMLNFLLMLGIAVFFYQVPLRGSLPFLCGATALFVVAEIGWGLLISATARTQQQAILFVFILAILDITFSGYMVPVKNLPLLLRMISRVSPMYHYLATLRAIMLKGAGLAILWPHVLALAGLGIVSMGIAARRVSRRLD